MARAETKTSRAKLDSKGLALAQRMKEIAEQARDSAHVGSVRITAKKQPPSNGCGCACSCC
jgi:hypothetical protein